MTVGGRFPNLLANAVRTRFSTQRRKDAKGAERSTISGAGGKCGLCGMNWIFSASRNRSVFALKKGSHRVRKRAPVGAVRHSGEAGTMTMISLGGSPRGPGFRRDDGGARLCLRCRMGEIAAGASLPRASGAGRLFSSAFVVSRKRPVFHSRRTAGSRFGPFLGLSGFRLPLPLQGVKAAVGRKKTAARASLRPGSLAPRFRKRI